MFSSLLTAGIAAVLATPASAFIRFGCNNNLVEERADPIVSPGQVASHAHKIAGGSGFGFNMTYDQARASKCSSCPIKDDFSNYWTPKLYYQYQNGSFQSVPTVGDSLSDQNGGMTVYYLQRGPAADSKTLKAFPEGFRMLAGDSSKRSFSNDFAGQAVSFACLGANKAETNGLPNYNCPGGLRAQVFFPSCWDGKNLDSSDHMSHMSYPASGSYNGGACPSTHPVQLISLFFEVLYDTNKFKDMWYGSSQPFVFANGDSTGYGFHGDFVNGWNVPLLQRVVDECTDLSAQGVLEKCAPISTYTGAEQSSCRLPKQIDEQVAGFLPALPGCNPVTSGPGPAPKADCSGQSTPQIGSGPATFTDVSSKGWGYVGCASDGDPRTLTGKTTIYSSGVADKMTVEYCIDLCKDYSYAGLEYGGECWCGNSVPTDRLPKDGIFGNCNMKCKGDSSEFCGGPSALSLYSKCTSSDCKNAGGSSGSSSSPASSPVSSPAKSPVVSSVPAAVSSVPAAVSSVAAAPVKAVSVASKVSSVTSKPVTTTTVSPVKDVASSGAVTVTVAAATVTVTAATATVTVTKGACPYRA